MLAPAVGEEKAREAIADAARVLGTARPDRVLEALAAEDGVLGVAARFVKMRAARREAEESWQAAARTVEASDLAELLAPSLGEEKSREVVLAALQRAELPAQGLDQARA